MPTETEDLTVSEIAARFGISSRTVLRRINDGTLTAAVKLPGRTGTYLVNAEHAAAVMGRAS